MSGPELSVVCRSCGSEVSPYVTECPYCGTRLRKRAPKLERHGDELAPREPRRPPWARLRLRGRLDLGQGFGERRFATIATVVGSAATMLVIQALTLFPSEIGAISGDVGSEWWRYLTAPFVYDNLGYLFVIALGVVIFGSAVEARLGTIATVVLILACGALGMLAADGVEGAIDSAEPLTAAGGNGVALGLLAAWAVMKRAEVRAHPDEDAEVIGAAVAAGVLVLLPLVVAWANVFAGLGGAVVGAACGLVAAFARRERRAG